MMRQPPQVQDHDQQATFTRLATEHARFLYRVAWSVLRHSEDAEDCVQEALLKLYRGESWRQMTNERAFLASVVWRLALDRRSARRPAAEEEAAAACRLAANTGVRSRRRRRARTAAGADRRTAGRSARHTAALGARRAELARDRRTDGSARRHRAHAAHARAFKVAGKLGSASR